jgi:hypothetical protein
MASERPICEACDGKGFRFAGEYCATCGGSGYRPAPAETTPETPDAAGDAMGDDWIPVDERQPDNDRLIWVMEQFGDGGEFTNFESTWGFYRKGRWLSYSHGELDESDYVRFWQEAPAPSARGTIQSQ